MGSWEDGGHLQGVCVALDGGLGNQLFQAAAGYALSQQLSVPLAFDLSSYKRSDLRSYELAAFPHGASLVSLSRARQPNFFTRSLARIGGRKPEPWLPGYKGAVYIERKFDFNPEVLALSAPCHLSGYFQSDRYFSSQAPSICAVFHPRHAVSQTSGPAVEAAQTSPSSVSIHVRRGDYVSNPKALAVHGALGEGYYRSAMAALEREVPAPHYFVFSDDIAEARNVVGEGPNRTFVEGGSAFEDLYLMSQCRHHIIANSSFSWWGAYFGNFSGQGRDGLTIAPRQWFTDEVLKKTSIKDLFPPAWRRL